MDRKFRIVSVSTTTGRVKGTENLGGIFIGKKPVNAAKKAATRICKASRIRGQCTLLVTIEEITKGSRHKVYTYKVKRTKEPVTIYRDGVPITFKYAVTAEKHDLVRSPASISRMLKRKSPLKKSPKKRKSPVKKSPKRKSPVKKSPKRKSPVKKSPKRKSPLKKKSPKRRPKTSPKHFIPSLRELSESIPFY